MVCAMTPSRSSNSAAPSSSSQARAGMSPSDFVFGSVLGQGSFAKVYHAQFKKTKANFAVKVMDQEFIKKHDKVPFVVMERQVMSKLSHPNIVKFYCSFKDDESLYMVMELCRGGELLSYICKERDAAKAQGLLDTACSVPVVQFYMAQLIVALQYIHSNQVIHRDLKPDNILFSEQGHLKVTDFGTATLTDSNEHATKFCGTAEYLSPEVLNDMPVGVGSDLWAVGCILFQMLTGRPPFRGETDFLTFQQILSHDSATMEFPAHVPETARDLIRQLLVLNLDARLIDYDAIQAHPFFTGIDWPNISKATPPVVPEKVDLPTPTMDGASPNWSLANVLNDVFGATALVADGPTDLHLFHRNNRSQPSPPSSRTDTTARRQSNASSSSTCMLENNENILLHGDVKLHGSLFTKKSKELLFTTHGRLVVADPKSPAVAYPWGDFQIVPKNSTTFDIRHPSGSFRITDGVHGTQAWCQMLSSFKP